MCNFLVMGITKTWLKNNDSFYNIDNYHFLANGREVKRGGGVGLYVRHDLNFIHRSDIDINTSFIESIFYRNSKC